MNELTQQLNELIQQWKAMEELTAKEVLQLHDVVFIRIVHLKDLGREIEDEYQQLQVLIAKLWKIYLDKI